MTTTSRAIEREARYHQNAYHFVYEALRFTQQSLNRGSAEGEESEDGEAEAVEAETPPKRKFESAGKIKLTSQDQKFLRALKIAIDEEAK